MQKIKSDFVVNQYRSGVESYTAFTKEVGLWDSEKYVIQKYFRKNDQILDLGCGTGRTTFSLHQMGFDQIMGVDLTPEMIYKAQELNKHFDVNIDFRIGDALALEFEDSYFDVVLFSFNGLMSVPSQVNRDKAIREISRVMKDAGTFIFTTHDREKEDQYLKFWEEEQERWNAGTQNPLLYEYGDLVTKSKNESADIYIHIPSQEEITNWLSTHEFKLVETFYRSDEFQEDENVKSRSGECRFWITKKQHST